ncbi:MAG: PEP-CTERM sorting domain-containing protein [Pirellula sp.]
MKTILQMLVALCSFSLCIGQGQAAVVSTLTLVERTPFVLGSPSIIDVVLQETRDAGETSKIGTTELIFSNTKFTWTGSSSFVVSNLLDHGIQDGRFFDNGGGSSVRTLDTSAKFGTVEQADFTPSASEDPLGTIVSATQATLRLASFTLGGGAVGDSITFTMSDFDPSLDDLVLADGTVLDSQVSYGSLTITGSSSGGGGGVVPEPSSIALFGSLVGGMMLRFRKRTIKQ